MPYFRALDGPYRQALALYSAVPICESDYSVSLTLENMYCISTYEKILAKSVSSGD